MPYNKEEPKEESMNTEFTGVISREYERWIDAKISSVASDLGEYNPENTLAILHNELGEERMDDFFALFYDERDEYDSFDAFVLERV